MIDRSQIEPGDQVRVRIDGDVMFGFPVETKWVTVGDRLRCVAGCSLDEEWITVLAHRKPKRWAEGAPTRWPRVGDVFQSEDACYTVTVAGKGWCARRFVTSSIISNIEVESCVKPLTFVGGLDDEARAAIEALS